MGTRRLSAAFNTLNAGSLDILRRSDAFMGLKGVNLDPKVLTDALKNLNDSDMLVILKRLPDADKKALINTLKTQSVFGDLNLGVARQLDELAGVVADGAKSASKVAVPKPVVPKSADELIQIEALRGGKQLVGDESLKVTKYFQDLGREALDVEADTFVKNWKAGGEAAFKNLPDKSQELLLQGNQLLRYQAKRSTGLGDKLAGACKAAPVFCDIGKGLGGLGAAVGVGYALEAVYDKVMDELDNNDDIAACVATCYPDDWYDSTASGSGDKAYSELTGFKTIESLRISTGNDNLTKNNTPICTKSQTGEQCATMCSSRCKELHKTFFQDLTDALVDPLTRIPEVAGGAFAAFLKGLGLDIPMFIVIVIVIIIILVLASTL
jgi:hypothetical protein